ncbi:MAG: Rab family GTPase [Candidatus Thorarchaeota archaeon]
MIVFKIVLIGDGGVGKTAIRERYLGHGFETQYVMTIGADFSMKDEVIHGNPIRYQIWDLAGQERFDGVRDVYYKGAMGALLVYDVSRPESYYNCVKWIKELWANNGRGKVPVVVVANKIDLRQSCDDPITSEQGRLISKKLSNLTSSMGFACHYVETSAKTGAKVHDAYSLLGENIMDFAVKRENLRRKSKPSVIRKQLAELF